MSSDILNKLKELESQKILDEDQSKPVVYSGSSYPRDERYKHPLSKNESLVYTDGGGHSWCYIYIDSERWILRSKFEDGVTSNSMELAAIARGLQLSRLMKKNATFFSDSQYAVNTINSWMHKWEKRGWKRGANGEVKNLSIIKTIFDIKKDIKVNGVWIKGHSGHFLNELCDYFVNETAKTRRPVIIEAGSLVDLKMKINRGF